MKRIVEAYEAIGGLSADACGALLDIGALIIVVGLFAAPVLLVLNWLFP